MEVNLLQPDYKNAIFSNQDFKTFIINIKLIARLLDLNLSKPTQLELSQNLQTALRT